MFIIKLVMENTVLFRVDLSPGFHEAILYQDLKTISKQEFQKIRMKTYNWICFAG